MWYTIADMAERELLTPLVDRIKVHIGDVARAEDQEELKVFAKKLKEELGELTEAAELPRDQQEKQTPTP